MGLALLTRFEPSAGPSRTPAARVEPQCVEGLSLSVNAVMPTKEDCGAWCDKVRALAPGGEADVFVTLMELELVRHDAAAKRVKRPTKKNHVRRSFWDVGAGMRQVGGDYHLYDDATPHVLNLGSSFFLFPTVTELCDRYGRPYVKEAAPVGVIPSSRTPQPWKWGPQNVLLTPVNKTVVYKGLALRMEEPGVYVVEVEKGRGSKKCMMRCLTVRTSMSGVAFRKYMSTLSGKIELLKKVNSTGVIGSQIVMGPQTSSPIQTLSHIP